MKLVVTEKNNAARKIASLLCDVGTPKADKVYDTPVYRFEYAGDAWVTIGLKGHILAPDFPPELKYSESQGWFGLTSEGEVLPCQLPSALAKPPFKKKKPFLVDGIDIKGWKMPSLPYLVWAPVEKVPVEKGIIRALKNLAKKAEFVVIGTDFDREGELIGSDALNQIRSVAPDVVVKRARYSALTKGEVSDAFNNLVELDHDLADAGESRQYIDLIWGAVLTRYLTMAKFGGFGNVRSAGRVQTPTLALVVEKERERDAHVPENYWVISGMGTAIAGPDQGMTFKIVHKTARFTDEKAARAAFGRVEDASYGTVVAISTRSRTQRPPAPFNTTTLQTAAAAEGIAPARTMRLAESLYMDGLISYPRVDNTVYPKSLHLAGVVKVLSSVPQYAPVCRELLTHDVLTPTRGKQETTDHPPIYPTAAASPEALEPAQWKLYNLIARRFLATLMGPATLQGTQITFDVAEEPFQARGDVMVHPGFRAIYPFGLKKDEHLPVLAEGERIAVSDMVFDAKQTEPPARYSQGRLIQEMEKRGLGTKSTRASIIERLYTVKYLKNDPIEPSQLGVAVIEALHTYAPHVTTPDMTSELEGSMTRVAEGDETQKSVVDHSRAMLAGMMDTLIEHTEDLGEAISDAITADARVGTCLRCGKDLVVKHSAKNRSSFVGCMGWPNCDVTYPVPRGRLAALTGENAVCSVCGSPRIKVTPFRSKPYEICINPACPTNREPDVTVGVCSVCEAEGRKGNLIAHKSEKTGKRFIRCSNYEICGTSYPLPQRGELHATHEVCPECGAPLVEIVTARGPWKICVNMDCPSKKKKTTRGAKTDKKASKSSTAKKRADQESDVKELTVEERGAAGLNVKDTPVEDLPIEESSVKDLGQKGESSRSLLHMNQ